MRYRRIPTEVEVFGPIDNNNARGIAKECKGHVFDANPYEDWVIFESREGTAAARTGDYVIRDVNGDCTMCKGSVFPYQFEEVT